MADVIDEEGRGAQGEQQSASHEIPAIIRVAGKESPRQPVRARRCPSVALAATIRPRDGVSRPPGYLPPPGLMCAQFRPAPVLRVAASPV